MPTKRLCYNSKLKHAVYQKRKQIKPQNSSELTLHHWRNDCTCFTELEKGKTHIKEISLWFVSET